MSRYSIETVTGEFVDFANPDPATISLSSVAWGLSRQPRFAGQTLGSIQYSVAQHSWHVADLTTRILTLDSELNLLMRETESRPEVVDLLNSRLRLEEVRTQAVRIALLHDASEAFLCDIPTPAKRLPGFGALYLEIEARLMSAIHTALNVPPVEPEIDAIVKFADLLALSIEVYHLIPSRGQHAQWNLPTPPTSEVLRWASPFTANIAYLQFAALYDDLTQRA